MTVLWWVLGTLAAAGGVFFAGMRGKWRPVVDGVRRMNRRFMNPMQMKTAGRPGAYAGIIRHVGRSSGRAYETPVGIEETPDGFVIALPYGARADWVRNVLASGGAELVYEGDVIAVDGPRVVGGADAFEYFDDGDLRTFRMMKVDDFLLLHRT